MLRARGAAVRAGADGRPRTWSTVRAMARARAVGVTALAITRRSCLRCDGVYASKAARAAASASRAASTSGGRMTSPGVTGESESAAVAPSVRPAARRAEAGRTIWWRPPPMGSSVAWKGAALRVPVTAMRAATAHGAKARLMRAGTATKRKVPRSSTGARKRSVGASAGTAGFARGLTGARGGGRDEGEWATSRGARWPWRRRSSRRPSPRGRGSSPRGWRRRRPRGASRWPSRWSSRWSSRRSSPRRASSGSC